MEDNNHGLRLNDARDTPNSQSIHKHTSLYMSSQVNRRDNDNGIHPLSTIQIVCF